MGADWSEGIILTLVPYRYYLIGYPAGVESSFHARQATSVAITLQVTTQASSFKPQRSYPTRSVTQPRVLRRCPSIFEDEWACLTSTT